MRSLQLEQQEAGREIQCDTAGYAALREQIRKEITVNFCSKISSPDGEHNSFCFNHRGAPKGKK